ncbi:MAG TPA: 2-hydroxychromene-2-carboxylate isomerase [Xanthomonadaceae bacterium]|nr:2-hydroxychromene-2-carboxylate isomerase [Xanthomonadaceae bacterium]
MTLRWYFDFISPFAYLQWPRVRALGEIHAIEYLPIVFAGLLDRNATKGPAEIPGKREFTYRFVHWRAQRAGVPLRFPPEHPFNPLPALRLCIAAGATAQSITAINEWIWAGGRRGDSARALAPVARELGIADVEAAISAPAVKARLKANFDAACADGVFGVPTLVVDGEPFWGEDATDFAIACLRDPELLADPEMQRLRTLPEGARRGG